MPPVNSEIRIDRALPVVASYLGHVPNLARWTTFFRFVGPERRGRYPVDSILGPIETWIETVEPDAGSIRHTICSIIEGQVERATLDLEADDEGVNVHFEIHLPDHLGSALVAEQRNEMGHELATLRALLEGVHAVR